MKDYKILKTKDFLNNIKIINLSEKIITYGNGYILSYSDINELCSIMNGYLHLMERVKEYERKEKDRIQSVIEI